MITQFFTGEGSSTRSSQSTLPSPPPLKKAKNWKKRNELTGFGGNENENRISNMKKRHEGGKWRVFQKMEIEHTIMTKDWELNGKTFRELFLCPFGMVETCVKIHSNQRNTVYNCIRGEIKDALAIKEDFNRNELKVSVSHMGNLGMKNFDHIFCRLCVDNVLPAIRSRYNLDTNSELKDIITNWDKNNISSKDIDLAGCFLPYEPHISAGPNGRRFIVRPEDHTLHEKYKKADPPSGPPSTSTSVPTNNKLLSSSEQGKLTTTNDLKVSVTIGKKTQKSIKMVPINSQLDPKIELTEVCKDNSDIWSKDFMLKVLHTGVNKHVSNNSSLEFYDTLMDGIHSYHQQVIPDIKFDGKLLSPPPKVLVNVPL